MPRGPPRDELRALQAASSDEFVATDPIYRSLYDRMHDDGTSTADCAKYYVDRTTALAAKTDSKRELYHFVEVFGASLVELAARTPYCNAAVGEKLVEFVGELQKAVVVDPESLTGDPLHFYEEQESVLWKDLPEFWLACAEERASFGKSFFILFYRRQDYFVGI